MYMLNRMIDVINKICVKNKDFLFIMDSIEVVICLAENNSIALIPNL